MRFLGEDIEAGAGDSAGLQGGDQRGFVDDATARDVDDVSVRTERGQYAGVDHVAVGGIRPAGDDQRIRPVREAE